MTRASGRTGRGEETAPKKKAEDNPWYLLATLYGVPSEGNDELRTKNRVAWNRYFAANLDPETRAGLIEEKRHSDEDLTPYSQDKLQELGKAFAERRKASAKKLALSRFCFFPTAPLFPDRTALVDFSNVEFEQYAHFERYLFSSYSSFQSATFSSEASFESATFSGKALFGSATFAARANFEGARFSDVAEFVSATFSRGAIFTNATFNYAIFKSAIFLYGAKFAHATFQGLSLFVDAEMKTSTSFEGATFKTVPPQFFGAELHEGTVWPAYKDWPTPKKGDSPQEFVRAYERLKLEMDRLKKHEDELDFFGLELRSRRIEQGLVCGFPIAVYGFLSDYGRSYIRPFFALLAVIAAGAEAFWYFGALTPWQSLGLSAANNLNVFGFRKEFIAPSVIACLPTWLEVVAAVQTILATILLFLFGLGIRNKFRMK